MTSKAIVRTNIFSSDSTDLVLMMLLMMVGDPSFFSKKVGGSCPFVLLCVDRNTALLRGVFLMSNLGTLYKAKYFLYTSYTPSYKKRRASSARKTSFGKFPVFRFSVRSNRTWDRMSGTWTGRPDILPDDVQWLFGLHPVDSPVHRTRDRTSGLKSGSTGCWTGRRAESPQRPDFLPRL